jgi:uncharacterized protein (UPF0303 family)
MEDADLIERLEAEYEELQFTAFGFEDAWAIGSALVEAGRKASLAIAIDVSLSGQTLFHAALPGTSVDNDGWIERKKRVTARFFRSSLLIATRLRMKGKSMEEVYGLPSSEYAASGGSVPIRVRGVGVVGAIAVSGLPDREDHALVVEAIRARL